MTVSPITRAQASKILKALAYSFISGFIATLTLVGFDFIHAAIQGQAAVVNLVTALLGASLVGGVNAVAVTIKQLLTPAE